MKIRSIFSNRNIFIAVTLAFAVWVGFLDRNNVRDSLELNEKIRELEAERAYYRQRIQEDSAVIAGLRDSAFVEKFAREHYLMRRDNEVIYLLKEGR